MQDPGPGHVKQHPMESLLKMLNQDTSDIFLETYWQLSTLKPESQRSHPHTTCYKQRQFL